MAGLLCTGAGDSAESSCRQGQVQCRGFAPLLLTSGCRGAPGSLQQLHHPLGSLVLSKRSTSMQQASPSKAILHSPRPSGTCCIARMQRARAWPCQDQHRRWGWGLTSLPSVSKKSNFNEMRYWVGATSCQMQFLLGGYSFGQPGLVMEPLSLVRNPPQAAARKKAW